MKTIVIESSGSILLPAVKLSSEQDARITSGFKMDEV
jgi:hypothetical protein